MKSHLEAVVRLKMAIMNCKRLRKVVMLASVFLLIGMFLEVFVHLLVPFVDLMFIQPVALGMVLASPAIMLLVVVISLIPNLSHNDCTQQ